MYYRTLMSRWAPDYASVSTPTNVNVVYRHAKNLRSLKSSFTVTKKKTAILLFGRSTSEMWARVSRAGDIPGLLTVRLDPDVDPRARFDALQQTLTQTTASCCCLLSGVDASAARALEQRLAAMGWDLALGIWLQDEKPSPDGRSAAVEPDEQLLADHFGTPGRLRKVRAVGDPAHIYRAVRKLILAVDEPVLPAPWTPPVPSRSLDATVPQEAADRAVSGREQPTSRDEMGGSPPDERAPSWKRLAAERKARGRRGVAVPRKPVRRT